MVHYPGVYYECKVLNEYERLLLSHLWVGWGSWTDLCCFDSSCFRTSFADIPNEQCQISACLSILPNSSDANKCSCVSSTVCMTGKNLVAIRTRIYQSYWLKILKLQASQDSLTKYFSGLSFSPGNKRKWLILALLMSSHSAKDGGPLILSVGV